MANETQNKPGDKSPVSKQPEKPPSPKQPEKAPARKQPDKAPAPKPPDKSGKTPEKPTAQNVKPTEQREASQTELEKMTKNNEKNMALAAKLADNKILPPKQPKNAPAPKQPEKAPAPEKTDAKKIVPFNKNKSSQKATAKKTNTEKKAPVKDGPTLAERKAELEKELREKFNIPKTSKKVEPWIAPEVEQVIRIQRAELHSFKDHPFNVDKDAKYKAFVASIRAHGVTQPAIVRPREAGGYEIISGHRRDEGSKDAEIPFTPCIVRGLNDDQAIQQMVEDNVNNRDIGTMELARALNMQLESIKHQGAQDSLDKKEIITADDVGKRSNQIVAERNGMSVKQVQRHIALTNLVPALQEMVDGKAMRGPTGKDMVLKISFTPAVELSGIKQKDLQEYIAVAIEGQQSAPSLSQAQRMRKLAEQKILNPDVIDGIMTEEKKEVDKVIISSQELSEYFGKDKTPREMKDTIINLLAEWKDKQKDISLPEKKNTLEK